MEIFSNIASRIIREQELIIGPIAWEEASKASGLRVDIKKKTIAINNGESNQVIDNLVHQYERLFGRASVEVCREAVKDIIVDLPKEQIPSTLK